MLRWRAPARVLLTIALTGAIGSACSARTAGSSGGKIDVVVAESFWGSIAAQLGGEHVAVVSLVDNPNADPHDYEPTASDGRAIASARYVIFNGLGYDAWAGRAIDANPTSDRRVLEIGRLLGRRDGDNPHRWYFPGDVDKVIAQITQDYKAIDPTNAAYYDAQRTAFETVTLKPYKDLLTTIEQRYGGTPVGASESIFLGLAEATHLDVRTPPAFLDAITEGTGPTPQDKATVDAQITSKAIAVFVYNSQNATPDVRVLADLARANGVAIATITETPPAGTSFQDWQTEQLRQLAAALAAATGR